MQEHEDLQLKQPSRRKKHSLSLRSSASQPANDPHRSPSKPWPAIVSKPKEMKRLLRQTPEITDLRQCIEVGCELGKKVNETSSRAHRHLYKALQFCAETYIRIASDDELKEDFFDICSDNAIKKTAASKPLAMMLKLVLKLDNKAASAYAMAIRYALDKKISPRKLASFFGKRTGGVQGCIAKARNAKKARDGKRGGAEGKIAAPRTMWTPKAHEALQANANLDEIVIFATMQHNGALQITNVLAPSRAMRKLRTHLGHGHSSQRKAA
jgi:hypothetical protein